MIIGVGDFEVIRAEKDIHIYIVRSWNRMYM